MERKIYMGGVCGMGMAPLALFASECGYKIAGFDDHPSKRVKKMLEKAGIPVRDAFEPAEAESSDFFVISSALKLRIGKDIPSECKILRRGKFLADEICASRKLTAVVGSHGKSTVTAMLAHGVNKLGAENCGYIVGAIPSEFSPSKFCEKGEVVFAEVDESDGTIENFRPEITVALNADLDHIDQYADASELEKMFERLFARTKKRVIILEGDDILLRAAKKSGRPFETVARGASFTATNARMAARALAHSLEGQSEPDESFFDDFGGVVRRQERLGKIGNLEIYADYAHHPNEVRAFLDWLKTRFDDRVVVFQPHRYTRTKRFAKEFAEILSAQACPVYIAPVYAASEPFDADGTSEKIAELSAGIKPLKSFEEFEVLARDLIDKAPQISAPRVLAVVGAGDLYFEIKRILNK